MAPPKADKTGTPIAEYLSDNFLLVAVSIALTLMLLAWASKS